MIVTLSLLQVKNNVTELIQINFTVLREIYDKVYGKWLR